MTCWVCSPWLSPYLSWLIQYSLPDRPLFFFCTLQGAKNKGGSVYSVCPLPSSTESFPSTSPTIIPKNHTEGDCVLKLGGKVDVGERKWRQGWKEGREIFLIPLTLLANKSLHNIGKIIWKAVQPSLFSPILRKCICSSEHDMAILPGTTINNLSQLNLDWCDSLSVMSLSLSAIMPLSFLVPFQNWKLRVVVLKATTAAFLQTVSLLHVVSLETGCSLLLSVEQ